MCKAVLGIAQGDGVGGELFLRGIGLLVQDDLPATQRILIEGNDRLTGRGGVPSDDGRVRVRRNNHHVLRGLFRCDDDRSPQKLLLDLRRRHEGETASHANAGDDSQHDEQSTHATYLPSLVILDKTNQVPLLSPHR